MHMYSINACILYVYIMCAQSICMNCMHVCVGMYVCMIACRAGVCQLHTTVHCPLSRTRGRSNDGKEIPSYVPYDETGTWQHVTSINSIWHLNRPIREGTVKKDGTTDREQRWHSMKEDCAGWRKSLPHTWHHEMCQHSTHSCHISVVYINVMVGLYINCTFCINNHKIN